MNFIYIQNHLKPPPQLSSGQTLGLSRVNLKFTYGKLQAPFLGRFRGICAIIGLCENNWQVWKLPAGGLA